MTIDELEKLADAATQDKWAFGSTKCMCGHPACHNWRLHMTRSNGGLDEADALYISAANPATIKQLIALVRLQHTALIFASDGITPNNIKNALDAFDNFGRER